MDINSTSLHERFDVGEGKKDLPSPAFAANAIVRNQLFLAQLVEQRGRDAQNSCCFGDGVFCFFHNSPHSCERRRVLDCDEGLRDALGEPDMRIGLVEPDAGKVSLMRLDQQEDSARLSRRDFGRVEAVRRQMNELAPDGTKSAAKDHWNGCQCGCMEEGLWRSDRIRKLPEAKTVAIRGSNAVAIELNPVFTSCGDGRQIGLPLKRIPSGAVNIRGVLDYDVDKRAFTRVDIVVLGDLYGDTDGNNWLGRPGRNPVGFAFELCSGAGPTDRLPPRGYMTQRDLERYLGSK